MAELKTQKNEGDVAAFLDSIEDDVKQSDCRELVHIMSAVTRSDGKMWGDKIVGFGSRTISYANGREGEWFAVGFAPRKQDLTLYIMSGFDEYEEVLGRLGRHSTGKSCLYVKRLDDIDRDVLRELIASSVAHEVSS